MLCFLPFKNKSFTFLLSISFRQRIIQRKIGVLQIKQKSEDLFPDTIIRTINGYYHCEEKDNTNYLKPIIVSEIFNGRVKCWCKNNKLGRREKDPNGFPLPARIRDHIVEWFKNGELQISQLLF